MVDADICRQVGEGVILYDAVASCCCFGSWSPGQGTHMESFSLTAELENLHTIFTEMKEAHLLRLTNDSKI